MASYIMVLFVLGGIGWLLGFLQANYIAFVKGEANRPRLKFAIGFAIVVALALTLVRLSDPYGDLLLAIAGKIIVFAIAVFLAVRRYSA